MTLEELRTHKGLVSDRQAAAALGLSRRTLQKWRQLGKGPRYRKVGGRKTSAVKYEPAEILRYAPEVKTTATKP